MAGQAVVTKAGRCSDRPALREGNTKKIFQFYRKWNGLFKKVASWIHEAKVPKEAELLNVLEQT
jgi:hypothetical protein